MRVSKDIFYLVNPPLFLMVFVAGMLVMPFQATADEARWYVGGAAFGRVIVDRNVSDFDDGSIISGRVDDKDSGWKLYGGYRYSKYLAVEFGRTRLNNDLDDTTTFTGQSDGSGSKYASGTVSVDIDKPIAYYLAAAGRLPMPLGPPPYDDRLALVGKIGVAAWKATETTIDSNGRVDKDKDGTNLMAGLALEYKWPNGIAIKSELEYYRNIVDEQYEFHALGLSYDF